MEPASRSTLALEIVEGAEDAFVVLDGQFRFIFVNSAAEGLLGKKEPELIGRTQWEAFPEAAGSPLEAGYRRAMDERVAINLETFDDTSQKWHEVRVTSSEEGGLVVRFRDVTERKRAEEAVRAERQRFADALDLLPAYLVLLAPDYRVPFANRLFREKFGESQGRRCYEYLFNRSEPCEICETYTVLKTNAPQRWEWTGPDGHHYDIYDFPFTDVDGSNLIMEVGLDITERKRAEEELAKHREFLEEQVKERTNQLEAANARLEADLEALTRMHALSTKVLEESEFEPLLQEIMNAAVAIVGAERGTLQLIEGDAVRIAAQHGHERPFLEFFASAEDVASVCGEAARKGKRVIVEDVEASPLFAGTRSLPVLREAGVRAVQSTPVLGRNGALLGILTTHWGVPHVPNERDLWRIDLLARQAADLIEYARAEAALRESEERNRRLAELLERSDQPFGVGYADGRLGYVNSAFERLTGYTRDELKSIDWVSTLTPPEWREVERAKLDELQCTGRPVRYEKEYVRKDGERVPIELLAHLVKDEQGRPLHYYWFLTDLTERKKAEAALRRLAQFPEENPNPVLRVGDDGGALYANAAARAWLAAVGGEVDQPLPAEIEALVGRASRERCAVEGEVTDSRGRTCWFSAVQPVGEQYVNLYGRDVSERKRAEGELRQNREWLRVTLTSIGDGVIAGDAGGRITFMNPVAASLTGWTPEEALGQPVRRVLTLINEDTRQPAEDLVERVLRERVPVCLANHSALLTREGREVPIEDSAAPILNAAGEVTGVVLVFHDVTEKRHAQAALAAAHRQAVDEKNRLRAVMETLPVGVALVDEKGGNVEANREFEKVWGSPRPPVESVGDYAAYKAWWAASGRPVQPEEWASARAVRKGETVVGQELEIERFDGTRAFVLNSAAPIPGTQGETAGAAVAIMDITARRRMEEALRESESRYRHVFEMMTEGFAIDEIVCDASGKPCDLRYLVVNPAFERQTGLKAADILGRTVRELFPDTEPLWIERFGKVALTGEPTRFEAWFGPLNRCFEVGAFQTEPGRFAVVFSDITDRKLAEEEIRYHNTVLEGLNRILQEALAIDTEEELCHRCLAVAEQVTESKFGFLGEINAEGRLGNIAISDPGWEACQMDDAGGKPAASLGIHGIYGRVLLEGKGFYTNDPESHPDSIGTPEGHPRLKAFLGVPLKHDGKTRGMIAVGNRQGGYRPQDLEALEALAGAVVQVLMRKRAEEAVREGEERLRQAQKMESIGVLAGGIAHDFNNLLTSILGNASLLQLHPGTGGGEQLRAIVESSEKAASLTRQLLAYAGKGEFQISDFDISRLVRSSADLLRVSIPKNIEVTVEVPRTLPAVRGDPTQIQQVLMNLVINAAESISEPSGGQVSVNACVRTFDEAAGGRVGFGLAPGCYISITVRDNGRGMDEQTKAKIFDPFFTTKFTGRGLGLAAVLGILKSHKGAITVESKPGQGSTFTVYLPSSGPRAAAAGGMDGMVAGGQAATVLVVDDEKAVRVFMQAALERVGHRVLLAENGQQALDVLSNHGGVDLVLLDIVMPVVGGAEAFREMRKRWPKMAVLVASGYSRQEAERFGIPADLPFLEKPYTAQRLAAAVEKALEACTDEIE